MENKISKNPFKKLDEIVSTTRNIFRENIENEISIFNKMANDAENITENVWTAANYVLEKNADESSDCYLQVYKSSEELSEINNSLEVLIHLGKSWDMENIKNFEDIEDILIDPLKTLTPEELNTIANAISDYSEFMYSEEYKNYEKTEDTLLKEDKQTIENCLDICDYMNLGHSIDPKTNIYKDNSEWKELDTTKDDDTGFYGKVYINENTKELIVGFCGTNSVKDITTDDLTMAKMDVPDQYSNALDFYNKYAQNDEYKDYKITLTGHSLGGSLAQLVASTDEVFNQDNPPKVITFNAFGTYNIIENQKENEDFNFIDQSLLEDQNVYNYITEGDLVSCTTKQIGKTKIVENKSDLLCLWGHMTESIHAYISPEKYLTEPLKTTPLIDHSKKYIPLNDSSTIRL